MSNMYDDLYYSIKKNKKNQFVSDFKDSFHNVTFFENALNSFQKKNWQKIIYPNL